MSNPKKAWYVGKISCLGASHPYLRRYIHTAGYVQKDGGISTYETHLLPMQPEPELESSIDALTHHYQQRRPAHDYDCTCKH